MKRHIAWLFSCGLLVGCAPSPPPIDEPSDPTPALTDRAAGADDANSPSGGGSAPAAFHFKSGVLEIGDFDPYTLGDDIFDPCTEISPEEFAAAGFHNVEPIPDEYAGLAKGLSACEVADQNGRFEVGFMNNNADREHVAEMVEILEYRSTILPSLYTHGPRSGSGIDCFAQVDTTRGGFTAAVPGFDGYDSQRELCMKAIAALEAFVLER